MDIDILRRKLMVLGNMKTSDIPFRTFQNKFKCNNLFTNNLIKHSVNDCIESKSFFFSERVPEKILEERR